jgi:spore maturation protein CgeB
VGLRVLILNTDYDEFLAWFYAQQPGLEEATYSEQLRARMKSLFGVADFYSSNLRRLGHEAWDVHANNEFMQKAWAREKGIQLKEPVNTSRRPVKRPVLAKAPLRYVRRVVRPLLRFVHGSGRPAWFYDILAAQIEQFRPDVLLNQDMGFSSKFLRDIKQHVRLLVGQHAATCLPDAKDWNCYDLVISSFFPTVEFFRQRGVRSELSRLGFEPHVLSCLPSEDRTFDCTFVGSFHDVHRSRTELLETLCSRFPQLRIWGPGVSSLSSSSAIRARYAGQAWGREMYQILQRSKIVLNHHGDVAPYANNLRLFEATGMGALLLTDWKENLQEMFEPGKEVAAYRTTEDCIEAVSYYLEHEEARASIAHAGQQRTLRDHNYTQRMEEFVELVHNHL